MSVSLSHESGTFQRIENQNDADVLILDAHTKKDLVIFSDDSNESSLFHFCNLTKTKGGAKVLRRRMERPWSSASKIRTTQASLLYILGHSEAFTSLPSNYVTDRVDHYIRDALPIVAHSNLVEFIISAFLVRTDNARHYNAIKRGVLLTCGLIKVLRRFVDQAELKSPTGELAYMIQELRALLSRTGLSGVPNQEIKGWTWKILRLDQLFRLWEKEALDRILRLTYEIDALVAMTNTTRKYGLVLPCVEEGQLRVFAEGLVHPFVRKAVPNSIKLDHHKSVLFLTGPNMAGKTTYLRSVATALYLAHLGMGVPANSFRFVPMQRLFCTFSISDDLHRGISFFRAEALRVKAIAQAVAEGYRVIAFMDEPFKGTNVKDAFDATRAIFEKLAVKEDCLFILSSHLIELSELLRKGIDYRCFDAKEEGERLSFDYLLRSGVSSQRLGMRVLHEEGIFQLLDKSVLAE
ncbi:MutS-related protein [Microbulbifer epialgicus]|uniref:DNA mismatch repair proteins mutS family domain-containing protein n=1 Tax=Microbulbifer epialgicus TaxID=393907 RepID=A0ABV4P6K2_9GAMM